ncbi:sensor histidine kinase [Roseateles sp. DB2]|uniref:sensor histidine kinase n=1 Tax=Roseateles sp. DB2 TaxID=3453717 RepID=UPI003EECBB67
MRAWKLWQPSLARRLLMALLGAFALVAGVLVLQEYLQFKRQMSEQPGIRQLADLMRSGIANEPDGPTAGRVLAGQITHLNALRRQTGVLPEDLLLQLYDREGRLVYASGPGEPIAQPGVAEQWLQGRRHWTWREDGERWSLRLAEPTLPDVDLLGWLARGLGGSMLLAFPLVLIPLWLAVHTGLQPLRRFAQRLGGLEADQALAPRELDLRYAELRPLGLAFDGLMARLRQRRARERAFVQDAAHELRTPLAVIAAQTHVLVQSADEQGRQEAGERLLAAIRRTSHLSQQLLDLASLDGKTERPHQRLDLVQASAQLLADLHGRARERGLTLVLEAPEQLPRVLDVAAFQTVLHNLLDNALRYVQAGGQIVLTLAGESGGGPGPVPPRGSEASGECEGWTLTVSDDGPGIAPEHRNLVFERFWRGPDVAVAGSGLGLAIVQQAVNRLGGRISLAAGPDGLGCTFTLSVPRAPTLFGSS